MSRPLLALVAKAQSPWLAETLRTAMPSFQDRGWAIAGAPTTCTRPEAIRTTLSAALANLFLLFSILLIFVFDQLAYGQGNLVPICYEMHNGKGIGGIPTCMGIPPRDLSVS